MSIVAENNSGPDPSLEVETVVAFSDLPLAGKLHRFQKFIAYLFLSSVLPFSPLIVEFLSGIIKDSSIVISVCMYTASVSMIARYEIFTVIGLIALIFLLPSYGEISSNLDDSNTVIIISSLVIAVFMTISNIINGWFNHIIFDQRVIGS